MKEEKQPNLTSPIENIVDIALNRLKANVNVDNVIGTPITTPDGLTIIPLSKVSVGYVAGGGQYGEEKQMENYPLSGGSGGGYCVAPIGFAIIDKKEFKIVTINEKSLYEQIISMIPSLAGVITSTFIKGDKK